MITPDRTKAPAVRELQGMRLPAVDKFTLPNGIRLVVLDSGRQPVSRLQLSWDGGEYDVPGRAAVKVLAATINEGTATRTGARIAETLEYNGAWTKYEVTTHAFTATLYGLNRRAAEVVPVFTNVLQNPIFPEEVIETQRTKLASQNALELKKVTTRVRNLDRPMLYGASHPAAAIPTPESYLGVTRSEVTNLYRRWIAATPPVAYLSGRITPELLAIVRQQLSAMTFTPVDDPLRKQIIPARFNADGDFRTDLMPDALQSAIRMSIPVIPRSHPDYIDLRYACIALGGYFGSRLMTNIREEKGYTYGINSQIFSGQGEGSFITVSSQTDNRYVDAVIEETRREIDRMAAEPMGAEELDGVRHLQLSAMASVLDSPFSVIDYISMLDTLGLPYSYYTRQIERLSALTPRTLQRVMAEHVAGRPQLIAVAGNYSPNIPQNNE